MTTFPMITISRECGSGGHEIAELLAKKLGLPMYDHELLTIAAKESGYLPEVIAREEQAHTSMISMAMSAISASYPYNVPLNNQLFSIQSSVIRTISDRESAIIVGRCADAVLKDYAPCINVFIQGSRIRRIDRIMKRDNLNYDDAEKQMTKIDKARATYYNFYPDEKWGARGNYDLIITSDIGEEACANILAAYITEILPELKK